MVVLDGVQDLCRMLLLLGVESRFVDFPFLFTLFYIIYLFIFTGYYFVTFGVIKIVILL